MLTSDLTTLTTLFSDALIISIKDPLDLLVSDFSNRVTTTLAPWEKLLLPHSLNPLRHGGPKGEREIL